MTNDVATLATALYATTDDMLKEHPDLAPWRPPVGITPRLSDAELVTLATMQAILASEAKWLRHARAHLRRLFPYLPQQPGYNKRLRKAAGLMRSVNRILATTTSVWSDDIWVVDSTPLECGRSRETVKRSDLAGWAEYGYCASHSRFFWGLHLPLVCTLQGLPIAFALTGVKADERETLLNLLASAVTTRMIVLTGRSGTGAQARFWRPGTAPSTEWMKYLHRSTRSSGSGSSTACRRRPSLLTREQRTAFLKVWPRHWSSGLRRKPTLTRLPNGSLSPSR